MKEKTIEGKKELAWAFYQVLGTFYGIHGPARIMNWLYDVAHGKSREISELFPIRPEERAKYEWHGNDAAQPAPGWISVSAEIKEIMRTYREQEAAGNVDTPGGLQHMGDVWQLLSKWDAQLNPECHSVSCRCGEMCFGDTPFSAAIAAQKHCQPIPGDTDTK